MNRKPFQGMWKPCVRPWGVGGLGDWGAALAKLPAGLSPVLVGPKGSLEGSASPRGPGRTGQELRPRATNSCKAGLAWFWRNEWQSSAQGASRPPCYGVPRRLPPIGLVEHYLQLHPAPSPCLRNGEGLEVRSLYPQLVFLVTSPPPGATQEPTYS